MRILVTGGSGFIGSNLVRLLIQEKGCTVINVDKLTYAGNEDSLVDLAGNANYRFEQVDLCDAEAVKQVFVQHQPDCVMHLAAESHVDRSIDGPGEFIQTNIVGTYNLLQASLHYWRELPEGSEIGNDPKSDGGLPEMAKQSGNESSGGTSSVSSDQTDAAQGLSAFSVSSFPLSQETFRFLHVSTDEVYGSSGPNDPPFAEASPLKPSSPYSASKAAADHLVESWHTTYGLPTMITRCGNNYGPNQHPEKLIPKVIQCCLKGAPIPVYGTGANIRDWIAVEDHFEALYTVLKKGRVGETYNIGGNNERQNIELVRTLCHLMDQLVPEYQITLEQNLASGFRPLSSDKSYESLITFVTDRPGHDMRYAIDPTKIRDELGWEPKEDFESGFRKTVQWYLENRDWWQGILDGSYQLERLGKS